MNLLYIAGLLALVLGGASPFSVDGWFVRRKERVETSESLS
ncbi:MAG TPA: hypothetical protein VNI84_00535 [Pyrinomonadaceae bacterium]|nr:hypothetical protein [Pyrinomonadaceae bacterium]